MHCTTHTALAATLLAVAAGHAVGDTVVTFPEPTLDRWMYPFNQTPGTKTVAKTFGAPLLNGFDDLDGQFILGYDTTGQIAPGQGEANYDVASVKVVVTVATDFAFYYDSTFDPMDWIVDEFLDEDDGHPAYLLGVAYRSGYSVQSWEEDSPFAVDPPVVEPAQGHRTAYASDYLAGAGRDVSNHIKDGFEFTAWAIATCSLNQGDLVPIETEYAFELDLANADVLAYVQQSLDIGQLNFAIIGQHPAFGGATDYPTYFCREAGLGAAHLEITLADGLPGDIDGDGDVDQSDLGILLAAYSSCEGDEYWNPDADLDGNGCVDQSDLGILLANYGL